uniref:Uncharacterized protein n=1 Tax=Linum usitatissimum TaxID=4006 RepID=A0A172MLI4_LINUS|nr:hypothetical protein [Linum usitatissimum]
MSFRSSTGKDVGLMLEAEDPWVLKRKGHWVRERPDLYVQHHEDDATKLHVSAKQSVIEISSDDDGNVRSLVECSGRVRKGGKDRNYQGTKERNFKAKDRQKCEAALNPISCKQLPDKGKREMDIRVCQKRSDGVCVGPVVWTEINKKNGGGFCGGSKVKSAGQMGKNSTKMGYKEGSEKASGSKRGRPTRESKSSVQDTIKERKSSVSKHRKKCKVALDPIPCKMLPDKVEDVAEHIGSTKQRNEVTMNSQIVVKEEYPYIHCVHELHHYNLQRPEEFIREEEPAVVIVFHRLPACLCFRRRGKYFALVMGKEKLRSYALKTVVEKTREAYLVFDNMNTKDATSWNGLISRLAQSGHFEEALKEPEKFKYQRLLVFEILGFTRGPIHFESCCTSQKVERQGHESPKRRQDYLMTFRNH